MNRQNCVARELGLVI